MLYAISSQGMKPIHISEGDPKNNLPRGTVLQLQGYCDPQYVIIERLEMTRYGAQYRAINLDDFTIRQHDTLGWKHIDERKNDGIRMYYTDERFTDAQVCDIIKRANIVADLNKKAAEQAAQATAVRLAELPEKFPYLATIANNPKKSRWALGAKNIRTMLKREFSGVKFSVTSESYSMGCAIRVGWTDGPTCDQVRNITNLFEDGSFDGMEDLYTNDKDQTWQETFGSAKYVTDSRKTSRELIKRVAATGYGPVEFDEYGYYDNPDLRRAVEETAA